MCQITVMWQKIVKIGETALCRIEIQKYSSCIANFKFNIYLGFDFSIILCFLENIKKMRTLLPRTTTLVLQSLNSFKKFQSSRDWQYFAQFCTNYLFPLWHLYNILLFHCTVLRWVTKMNVQRRIFVSRTPISDSTSRYSWIFQSKPESRIEFQFAPSSSE